MLIANPIYDATFKHLLENNRVAKFLIGVILDCKVLTLEHVATEHAKKNIDSGQIELYRKDFSATIETKEEGKKRVIIEMQKVKTPGDIGRFRKYIGGEYTRSELPIIAIYILGFNLSVNCAAFSAYPEYRDLRTNEPLKVRDGFVDKLTHKAYFVQTPYIKPSLNSKLDMVLSLFEQANFASKDKTLKVFPFETDDPDFKELLGVLHYAAADENIRKELDEELYFQDYVEDTFGETFRELQKKDEALQKQAKEMQKKDLEMQKKDLEMQKKDEEMQKKDEEIQKEKEENRKQAAEIAALKQQLEAMKK